MAEYSSPYADQFMAAMRDAIRNADTVDRAEGLCRHLTTMLKLDEQQTGLVGAVLMTAVGYTAARDHASVTPDGTLAVIAVAGQMFLHASAPTAPDGSPW